MFKPRAHRPIACLTAGLVLLLAAATALGSEFEKTFTFDSDDLEVVAMIGSVEVVAADGKDFTVTVRVRGTDADPALITFVEEPGRDGKLAIVFPLKEHSRYVYPELGNSSSTIHFRDENVEESSWLKKVFAGMSGQKVTVSGKGRGLEMWADVTIAVPGGAGLRVRHGVGAVRADKVAGDLDLDTHSGAIAVAGLTGNLRADTGSGAVTASAVNGNVSIDTGSGSVEVEDIAADKVHVDTGSGSVRIENVSCEDLLVDTGSGGVRARGVAADQAKIDTGSGSVKLQLDRMGGGRFVIDTGSGGIELELPDGASARISADTGSGSVKADVAGATIEHKDQGELQMTVGDGKARVTLDAGSGSITISQR